MEMNFSYQLRDVNSWAVCLLYHQAPAQDLGTHFQTKSEIKSTLEHEKKLIHPGLILAQ